MIVGVNLSKGGLIKRLKIQDQRSSIFDTCYVLYYVMKWCTKTAPPIAPTAEYLEEDPVNEYIIILFSSLDLVSCAEEGRCLVCCCSVFRESLGVEFKY